MNSDLALLALRILDQDHALEAGRDYVLGSAADCDLRVAGQNVAPHHLRVRLGGEGVELLDLGSPIGTVRNGHRVAEAVLEAGDVIGFGDGAAVLVPDDGGAMMVPLPELRTEATQRRLLSAHPPATVRRFEGESFHDLMAAELRRAPWLAISLAAHAVLLLALWLLLPAKPTGGATLAAVTIDIASAPMIDGVENAMTLEVVVEPEPELTIQLDEVPEPIEVEVIEDEPLDLNPRSVMVSNPNLASRAPPPQPSATRGTGNTPNVAAIGSEGFQKTVAQMQDHGLEIVFVFDSSGSMGLMIRQTKQTIAEMLDVLRALVPNARFGLITYRDHGKDEEYVLQQVPLSQDFWHAANFVQSVSASGGGDRPEAVDEALRAAFRQPWRRNSKRVVILAGDAPAHDRAWTPLQQSIADFAKRGSSHVHALVTSPRNAGRDTQEQFEQIAHLGAGECLQLDRHEQVLHRVLDLAFDRQFEGDLAAVRQAVADGRDRTETWALDLSRRGGSELAAALRQKPVPSALLNALVRLPKQRVTLELLGLLTSRRTPGHSRQAIAWALQRILDLPMPPVDALDGTPVKGADLRQLHQLAERLPR